MHQISFLNFFLISFLLLMFSFSPTNSFGQGISLPLTAVLDSLYCSENPEVETVNEILFSSLSCVELCHSKCDIKIIICDDYKSIKRILRKKKQIYIGHVVTLESNNLFLFSLSKVSYRVYKKSKGKLNIGLEEHKIKVVKESNGNTSFVILDSKI